MIERQRNYVREYKRTLNQAVNVLAGIRGHTQFNRSYNEFQRRLSQIQEEMSNTGLSTDFLLSHEFLSLNFGLFNLKVKDVYRQIFREEVA